MSFVIVSHAIGVNPDSFWYPALREDLAADDHEVTVVGLPDAHEPDPAAWLTALLDATSGRPAADTVLVGHSLGGVNVLRLLQNHDLDTLGAFAGVVLVATMVNAAVGYESLQPFFEPRFDWDRIGRSARAFRVLTALDDPVLDPDPLTHVRILTSGLGATAVVSATGGHFPSYLPGETPAPEALPRVAALVRECLVARV